MSHRVREEVRTVAVILFLLLPVGCVDNSTAEDPDLGADLATPATELGSQRPFLSPDSYAEELKIDPAFPFGVTRRYTTPRDLRGARWGRHGGPMITEQIMMSGMPKLAVTRFTPPAPPVGELAAAQLVISEASGLPAKLYYGDMVDLLLTDAALLSYTTAAAHFQGEALLYRSDYGAVKSRAFTNGFYDVVDGGEGRILYTGLSGLTPTAMPMQENGLWRSELCNGSIVPTGGCAESRKLIGWNGYSGPIARDGQGNVFVAASLAAGSPSDAVYALTRADAEGAETVMPTTLLSLSTSGTSSVAAVAQQGGRLGWCLQKGYDSKAAAVSATAQAYELVGGQLAAHGAPISSALSPGTAATAFSLLTDAQGGLWVVVAEKAQSVLLELERLSQ